MACNFALLLQLPHFWTRNTDHWWSSRCCDAEFQRKCMGKMDEVSKSGRTVLFVSHNMNAVTSLCSKCIHLKKWSCCRHYETRFSHQSIFKRDAYKTNEKKLACAQQTCRRFHSSFGICPFGKFTFGTNRICFHRSETDWIEFRFQLLSNNTEVVPNISYLY